MKRSIKVTRQLINRGFNPRMSKIFSSNTDTNQEKPKETKEEKPKEDWEEKSNHHTEEKDMSLFRPIENPRERTHINEWKNITGKETIFVSFISDPIGSDFYSSRIEGLVKKLNEFGSDYIVRQYPSDRHYFQNCCFKPVFIKEIIEKYDKNIVWIDGDTHIKKCLGLFTLDGDYDIGLVSYTDDISSFVASPIFFRNTLQSKALIDAWEKHCTLKIENGICELDHDAIKHSIIPQFKDVLKIKLNDGNYHRGDIIENVNSSVPEKRIVIQEMASINSKRPFNLTNKDFNIV